MLSDFINTSGIKTATQGKYLLGNESRLNC